MSIFFFNRKTRYAHATICALFGMAFPALSDRAVPPVLSSGMVIQQGVKVPVWGTAAPGEKITVSFKGQTVSATADAQSNWVVRIGPFKADGLDTKGSELILSCGSQVTLKDVLVGEVWLGSGQSNMDTPVNEYPKDAALKAVAASNYPAIRLYQANIGKWNDGWGWHKATDWRKGAFSAQLFYFGVRLQQALGVPVGLIEAAQNGSPSAPFLSQEAFDTDPDIRRIITKTPALAEQKTGDQYNRMIRPLVPFAIRGVYWDQGEGGAGAKGLWQAQIMKALIRSWREAWGQGDFPWLYVQKPSGGGCALDPRNPLNEGAKPFEALPERIPASDYHSGLRAEGYAVLENPNTFLVVNSDLSMGVHPPIKSSYGERGFLIALGAVYGRKTEYYGPVFKSASVEGGRLRIAYTHVGKGLAVPEGQPLQGFLIAGDDKNFRWAEAVIDGQTVLLSHAEIPHPVFARYAWTWPLAWANLFNADGLPALGFRTDN